MPTLNESLKSSSAYTLVSVFLVVAALHLAEDVLVPLALAILLSFLLGPFVSRIELKLRTGRIIAVLLVSLVATGVLGGVGWLVTNQLGDLAGKIPQYKENLKTKIHDVRKSSRGVLSQLQQAADEIQDEMNLAPKDPKLAPGAGHAPSTPLAPAARGVTPEQPVWTQTVTPPPSPVALIRDTLGPLLVPLTTLGIVLVLSFFLLIHREDLRDKVIRLIGESNLTATTEAMDEAAHKVGMYLAMQLLVNVSYGVPVGVGLYLIGVPNAALFGVIATLLRFVPYIGPWIAAAMPIAIAFAISDSWHQPLYAIGLFVVLELISNNIIEPLLYGRSTGLSAVAILISAIFWTWCWGSVGLLLSTPLTVCLVVLGKYVPQLEFLAILLGDQPALEPSVRVYQRLLALDQDEASRIVYDYGKQQPLPHVFENLLLVTLRLSEEDRERGVIDSTKAASVREGVKELMEESLEVDRRRRQADTTTAAASLAPPPGTRVVCLPARDEGDEIAGLMLSQLLSLSGVEMSVVAVKNLASEMVSELERDRPTLVVVSALPPGVRSHTRYLLKRVTTAFPALRVVIGLWGADGERETIRDRISADRSFTLTLSLEEAAETIRQLVQLSPAAQETATPVRTTPSAEVRDSTLPSSALPEPIPG